MPGIPSGPKWTCAPRRSRGTARSRPPRGRVFDGEGSVCRQQHGPYGSDLFGITDAMGAEGSSAAMNACDAQNTLSGLASPPK